jgi:HSP20 family protein
MTLNRWDPFKDLLNFQERMARLIHATAGVEAPRRRATWRPVVDIMETSTAYVLRADLPGVGRDKINVEIRGSKLTIQGERPIEDEPQDTEYHHMERETGYFERTFTLPGNIDVDRAKATYADGVLDLVLPKSAEEQPDTITVVCMG